MASASLLLLLSIPFLSNCSYQALQISAPVTLAFSTPNTYQLTYPIPQSQVSSVLFCFTLLTLTYGSTTSLGNAEILECELQRYEGKYLCVNLYSQDGSKKIKYFQKQLGDMETADSFTKRVTRNQHYTSSPPKLNPTLQKTEEKPTLLKASMPNITDVTISFTPKTFLQSIQITDFFIKNSFYHMYTCPSYKSESGLCETYWKSNNVHTHIHPSIEYNLILQRHHKCSIYSNNNQLIYNHVFYGGALRQNQETFFVAMLSYFTNTSEILNMWGGILYSHDHANRDMFCYGSDGAAFDGISLVAGPGYKDIGDNIEGKDDAEIIDNSYSQKYQHYHMNFIHYHRKYNTGDRIGDENIVKKIYNQFSYAAYFENVQGRDKTTIVSPSCLGSYHHNFMMRMPADVAVWEKAIIWGGLIWGIFLGLMVFVF